eukprot:1909290-Rhodomonas_salina.1
MSGTDISYEPTCTLCTSAGYATMHTTHTASTDVGYAGTSTNVPKLDKKEMEALMCEDAKKKKLEKGKKKKKGDATAGIGRIPLTVWFCYAAVKQCYVMTANGVCGIACARCVCVMSLAACVRFVRACVCCVYSCLVWRDSRMRGKKKKSVVYSSMCFFPWNAPLVAALLCYSMERGV